MNFSKLSNNKMCVVYTEKSAKIATLKLLIRKLQIFWVDQAYSQSSDNINWQTKYLMKNIKTWT